MAARSRGTWKLQEPEAEGAYGLARLRQVVDRLLGPGGCPWDREQTHQSLRPYLIEEAYEVADAIEREDMDALKEELGDLLLQPFMHAQMERLAGGWDIEEVAEAEAEKLVRRHPHVFGEASAETPEEVLSNWDRIKRSEKPDGGSALGGVPRSMPALMRALEVSKRAARVGFEWPGRDAVIAKVEEELTEVREALAGGEPARVEEELGDLLFAAVNLARWSAVEPELALGRMIDRFYKRFEHMEAASGGDLAALGPDELDRLWRAAKREHL